MRNKYPGICYKCGCYVPVGHGFFELNRGQFEGGKWRVQCLKCCDGRDVTHDIAVNLAWKARYKKSKKKVIK